ncbi:MAG TPA: hypothetical protein PL009_01215 [Flavipsychrobacter sp.]|nr:hypothetical protein [Flavipsychrobacter sp.]
MVCLPEQSNLLELATHLNPAIKAVLLNFYSNPTLTNKERAAVLHISLSTYEKQLGTLFRLLGISCGEELKLLLKSYYLDAIGGDNV